MTPEMTAYVVPAWAASMSTPVVSANTRVDVASAIPSSPSAYSAAPATSTQNAPNRSASMPAKMPNAPQARFGMAMASAKVSRDQPWGCVMGCSHKPKPWRMPMENVTINAPHSRTYTASRRAREDMRTV